MKTATKKSKLTSYRRTFTMNTREALISHLTHDRMAMAGKLEGYDPYLGSRYSQLRKQTANAVISLVLNRTK
jgi:hypothetical protein